MSIWIIIPGSIMSSHSSGKTTALRALTVPSGGLPVAGLGCGTIYDGGRVVGGTECAKFGPQGLEAGDVVAEEDGDEGEEEIGG